MRSALKLVQPYPDEDCAIADDVCNKQKKTVCPTLVQSGVNDKNTLTQIQLLNFALEAAKFHSRPNFISMQLENLLQEAKCPVTPLFIHQMYGDTSKVSGYSIPIKTYHSTGIAK